MNISLYKYNGERIVANKVKGLSPVFTGDITPYGEFNANNVYFRLDQMYDVNLAKYTYNGHDYYGSVTVNVDSKHLINYQVTVDPLTTAWYEGCMNTSNVCEYSDYPITNIFDPRVKYVSAPSYSYINLQAYEESFYVAVVVARPAVATPSVSTDILISNPGVTTYIFNLNSYNEFMYHFTNDLTAKEQTALATSIIKTYVIPAHDLSLFSSLFYTNPCKLYRVNGSSIGGLLANDLIDFSGIREWHWPQSGTTPTNPLPYVVDYSAAGFSPLYVHTSISNFELNSWRRNSIIYMVIENMGILKLNYDEICCNASITDIGYKKYIDYSTGTQKAVLVVNGQENNAFTLIAQYPECFPFMYDNSIVDWRNVTASTINSVISLAVGIGSIALAAPTGGLSLAASVPMLGSAVTSGVSVATEVSRNVENEQTGSFAISGGTGGGFERVERKGSYIVIREFAPINLTDVQSKYGKPDGASRNLSTLSGFVKTANCRLLSNGLPEDIITEAESACNGGFRIA